MTQFKTGAGHGPKLAVPWRIRVHCDDTEAGFTAETLNSLEDAADFAAGLKRYGAMPVVAPYPAPT